MKCGYCGNGSGKTDARGNCVSCGATLESPTIVTPVTSSWVDVVHYSWSTDAPMDISSLPSPISSMYTKAYLKATDVWFGDDRDK